MLTTAELRRWVSHFGVPEQQIRRDHLLSHVLQALARLDMELVFFGGTSLCRTHLVDWRLAEAGLLGDEAIAIAADVGWHPTHWMFDDDRVPSSGAWQTALGQQMAVPPDPAQALRTVREHVFRING